MESVKKFAKRYRPYLIIFAVVLLAEVFIFNCKTFALIGGGYKELSLPAQSADNVNGNFSRDGIRATADDGYLLLEYKGLNRRVKTIYLDMELSSDITEKEVEIRYKDATYTQEYRTAWTTSNMKVINGNKRSQYATINVSGDVSDLKIKMNLNDNENVVIKSIAVNKTVPFHFSIVRFLILYVCIWAVYMLAANKNLKKSFNDNKKTCLNICTVITAAVIVFMVFLANIAHSSEDYSFIEGLGGEQSGNQISQEIVDAFEAGQVSLLKQPSETMLSLENPYDYSQRVEAGVNNEAWDHCLYNGKYYSYYGVGPVLTLFLPFHVLNGSYFATDWAVLIYAVIGVVFLSLLYKAFIKKFFGHISSAMAVMGHFMIMVSSGIFFSVIRPMFYEISIASAFAAVAAGAYFMMTSNVIGEEKIKKSRLAVSTACLGFSVLCRPTAAIYCVASLAFIWFGFRKLVKADGRVKDIKNRCTYLLCAFIPYVVFGGFQMWYNYARFDSPLDFGIKYSLTINDFTATEFHIHFMMISLFAFIFAIPQIKPEFPYVTGAFTKLDLNGFYFADDISTDGLAVGAIFRALPVFSYLFGVKAVKKLEKGKRLMPSVLIILTCILAPLIIVYSTWESGFAIRYYADFSWQLLIGALAIAFFLYGKCDNDGVKKIAETTFIVMTVLCLIINGGQIYNFLVAASKLSGFTSDEWLSKIYSFARLFNFWI